MEYLYLFILIFLFTLFIRILPIWHKRFQGCDAYYFLLYREYILKQKKVFPVFRNYFLLEDSKQSYPPGFAIFLTLIPKKVIKNYYWLISPMLDSLISLTGIFLIFFITQNIIVSSLTGIGYIFCYAAIKETTSMNSRQLGVILLSLTILPFGIYLSNSIFFYLIISLIPGFFLLMTHKLSFQSLWFILPFSSIVLVDWRPFIFLLVLVAFTIILSFGGYFRVIRGHLDIIKYWYRNSKNLFSHQVYESEIYRNPEWKRKKIRYPDNIFSLLYIYGKRLFVYNPFIILALPVIFINHISTYEYLLYLWVILTYIFAFLTIIIPQLRCIGEGEKYLKLVALPTIYLSILPYKYHFMNSYVFFTLWILLFIISISEYYYEIKVNIKSKDISSHKEYLKKTINYIKSKKIKKLMCIPNNYNDSIAYHCRISTLWGTHNPPMVDLAEDYFPVLKKPLEYFIEKYEVNYLLLDKNYCNAKYLKLDNRYKVFEDEQFAIYIKGY